MSSVWTLEFAATARKQLRKLSEDRGERIVEALEVIAACDDPRSKGVAMTGKYAGHWRYRIGDYRAIARIDDGRLTIIVIAVGHRREIYR